MSPLNRLENWFFQKLLRKIIAKRSTTWLMKQIFNTHRKVFSQDNIFDHQDIILQAYEKALVSTKIELKIRSPSV